MARTGGGIRARLVPALARRHGESPRAARRAMVLACAAIAPRGLAGAQVPSAGINASSCAISAAFAGSEATLVNSFGSARSSYSSFEPSR